MTHEEIILLYEEKRRMIAKLGQVIDERDEHLTISLDDR